LRAACAAFRYDRAMPESTALLVPQLGPLYQALAPWAETAIRILVGLALVPHGMRFAFGMFPNSGSRALSMTALTGVLARSGYWPPVFWAWAICLVELAGGPLLALGLFTRPVALAVFIFLVNAVIEHARHDGYFWNTLGLEYCMIWSAASLFFVIHGGGLFSLDHALGHEF
jgi:putative oxidoreductase